MNYKELSNKITELETSGFSDVLAFVKDSNCYSCSIRNKNCHVFWQSSLPVKWFNEFIEESFFDTFLFGYFSEDKNANPDFIKLLTRSNKQENLIQIVKLTEAFSKILHWESFSIFNTDTKLKQFYKELKFIKDHRKNWDHNSLQYIEIIEDMDYEDILIQVTSQFEQFKRYSVKSANNRNILISYQAHLKSILNTILNIKKTSLFSEIKVENKYDSEQFKIITQAQLPNTRPIKSFIDNSLIPKENSNEEKDRLRSAVEFLFAREDNEYQINKYLAGLAEFEVIDGLDAELNTNEKYNLYRRTLEKGINDDVYFTNQIFHNSDKLNRIKELSSFWDKQLEIQMAAALEYYKFLNIPIQIQNKYNQHDIDLEKVLFLLITFSNLLMPQGRLIFNDKISFKRDIPKSFQKLFQSDYVVSIEESELIEKCKGYFNWKNQEIQTILDFLTTDLSSERNFKIDFTIRPFIKIGQQYIWLSSFLKDSRWEVVLHKRIAVQNSSTLISQPALTEKYIADMFKNADFGSVASLFYNYRNLKGEIDVLAYKENTLFLVELKSTYVDEDILKTSKYEAQKFTSLASMQLNNARDYIENNFDEVKAIEELGIDCTKDDLNITSLIVSNIYQSDNLIFDNQHLKISLFELLIILKNDLHNMRVPKLPELFLGGTLNMPIESYLNIFNRANLDKNYISNEIDEQESNLWQDNNNCRPSDIISAIKENKVWKHQNANENLKKENIELTVFNVSHTYLD